MARETVRFSLLARGLKRRYALCSQSIDDNVLLSLRPDLCLWPSLMLLTPVPQTLGFVP